MANNEEQLKPSMELLTSCLLDAAKSIAEAYCSNELPKEKRDKVISGLVKGLMRERVHPVMQVGPELIRLMNQYTASGMAKKPYDENIFFVVSEKFRGYAAIFFPYGWHVSDDTKPGTDCKILDEKGRLRTLITMPSGATRFLTYYKSVIDLESISVRIIDGNDEIVATFEEEELLGADNMEAIDERMTPLIEKAYTWMNSKHAGWDNPFMFWD